MSAELTELKLTPEELSDLKYGLGKFVYEYEGCYDKDSSEPMDLRFFRIVVLYKKLVKINPKDKL